MTSAAQPEQAGDQSAEEYALIARREGVKISNGKVLKTGSEKEIQEEADEKLKNTFRGGMMYDCIKVSRLPTGMRGLE
jgi:hypothetical protein